MKKIYLPVAAALMVSLSTSAQKETREKAPQRQDRPMERRNDGPRMEAPRTQPPTREQRMPQPDRRNDGPRMETPTREPRMPQPDRRNETPRTEAPTREQRMPQPERRNETPRTTEAPTREHRTPQNERRDERTAQSGFDRRNRDNNDRTREHNGTQERRHNPNNIRINTPAPQQRNFTTNQFNRRTPFIVRNNFYPDYRRPYSYIGRRYTSFYRPRFYSPFFGINYYYSDGFFYRPYDSYFQIVIAPIGIHVFALPYGYRRFYIGPSMYYYYGGTYYTRNTANYYEVVDAPIGSILPELPEGTTVQVVDGHKYHVINGTYYQETLRGDETWYTIVGKNGVISTKAVDLKEDSDAALGDVVTELPDDVKVVVLNNKKYYVADETYYEEVIENNALTYRVIAKPQ